MNYPNYFLIFVIYMLSFSAMAKEQSPTIECAQISKTLNNDSFLNADEQWLKEYWKLDPKEYPNLKCNLTAIEMGALQQYNYLGYGEVNKALRTCTDVQQYLPVIRTIYRALLKLKPFEKIIYRGVSLENLPIAKTIQPQINFNDPAFLSTSYLKKGAFFGDHQFTIESKNCRKIDGLVPWTRRHEAEVLCFPDSKFLIISAEKIFNETMPNKIQTNVHMTEVGQPEKTINDFMTSLKKRCGW